MSAADARIQLLSGSTLAARARALTSRRPRTLVASPGPQRIYQ